jgi:hypothetical protein
MNTSIKTDYIMSGSAPYGDMILLLGYVLEDYDVDEETSDPERQKRKVIKIVCLHEMRN